MSMASDSSSHGKSRRPSLPRGTLVENADGKQRIVFARQGRDHLMITNPLTGHIDYVSRDQVTPVLDSAGKQIRLDLDR